MGRYFGFLTIFCSFLSFGQTVQYSPIVVHEFKGKIIRSYCISEITSGTMFVGLKGEAGDAKVYQSMDNGSSWSVLNQGEPICPECEDVQAICQIDENVLLVGTWKNGLFISKDKGKSFGPVKGFPAKDVRSICHSKSGKTFAATTSHGILMSENMGKKWSSIHDEELNKKLAAWKILLFKGSKDILYAMTFENGIYKSIDAGVSWKAELAEDGLMFWDMDFIENEIYAIASNDSLSYLFKSFIGDKKWKKHQLNIPTPVNSMNIVNTFQDFYFLFGTQGSGVYKSYAIEHSIDGFRCTEIEKESALITYDVYSNNERIYNFTWGDGLKIMEREEECELLFQQSLYISKTTDNNWGLQSNCDLDYFHFKLYDKWGQLVYEKQDEMTAINEELKRKVKELKQEPHIYWIKFSFTEEKDTLDLKGHVEIKA